MVKFLTMIIKYILPIVSSTHYGYYLIVNDEELKEYIRSIKGRIDKMNERLYFIVLGYKRWKGTDLELSKDMYDNDEDEDLEE